MVALCLTDGWTRVKGDCPSCPLAPCKGPRLVLPPRFVQPEPGVDDTYVYLEP